MTILEPTNTHAFTDVLETCKLESRFQRFSPTMLPIDDIKNIWLASRVPGRAQPMACAATASLRAHCVRMLLNMNLNMRWMVNKTHGRDSVQPYRLYLDRG